MLDMTEYKKKFIEEKDINKKTRIFIVLHGLNIKFIKYVTSDFKICTCTYYVNLPSLYVTLRNYRVTFQQPRYLKSSDRYAKI